MPELKDDDESLQEMRDIFKTYDSDGSGELDEEEFVQVLVSAGWEQAEALGIFQEVNTDGEGGVGLEEFEAWWKGQLGREVGTACLSAGSSTTPC